MKKKVSRVGVVSLGKIQAIITGVLYALIGLLLGPFYIATIMETFKGNLALGVILGLILGPIIGFVMGAIAGFIGGIITGWLYNLAARFVGPLEIELG